MSDQSVSYTIGLKDLFSPKLAKASASVDSFEGKIKGVGKSSQGLGISLGSVFKGLGIGIAASQVWDLGKTLVKSGADMQQTRMQFETFTGSVEKGNAVIADLQKFSAFTPFEDSDIIPAGRSLLAFGEDASSLIPTLTKLGNISAGTGKNIGELTSIYGKNKLSGIVQGEDINQLVEAGIPVMDSFARQLGVSVSEVRKMGSEGKITFGMLDKAFDELGAKGGKWGDLMDKQSQTLAGRWSTVTSNLQNMGTMFGESLIPTLGKFVDAAGDGLGFIKDNLSNLKQLFAPLAKAFRPIVEAVERLGERLGFSSEKGKALEGIFNSIGRTIEFFSPVLNVIGEVVGLTIDGIGQIWTALSSFVNHFERPIMALYTGLRNVFVSIAKMARELLGGVGNLVAGIFSSDVGQIKAGLKGLGAAFTEGNALKLASEARKGLVEGYEKGFSGTDFFQGSKKEEGQKLTFASADPSWLRKSQGSAPAGGKSKGLGSAVGSVSGQGPRNITINIGKLIDGGFNITTTNMGESYQKIKEAVSKVLLEAVNDANLLASGTGG